MKPRDLHTIHDVIVTNYDVRQLNTAAFRHSFSPATTATVYEFETKTGKPILQDGDRYNIGFTVDNGKNIIELSALAKADTVNKWLSYAAAQAFSNDRFDENKNKNDQRVTYSAPDDGYYWGKKYAWRQYGLVIAKSAFYQYLEEIHHPYIPCVTSDPDSGYASNTNSVAFKEDGLEKAMDELISTAMQQPDLRYFVSPLYTKKFQIRNLGAITDKK